MASKHREGVLSNLVLLLPAEKRQEETEKLVSESLKNYFRNQSGIFREEGRKKLLRGILLLATGVTVMIINSLISYTGSNSFGLAALRVLLEPAGWFLVWTAIDNLFYELQELRKEGNFYKEISTAHVQFRDSRAKAGQ